MHRRRVLQLGAAAATLPLAGCGVTPPVPATVPDGAAPPPVPPSASAAPPSANATAVADVPPVPDPSATEPAVPPPVEDGPSAVAYSRVIARVGKNHGHVLEVSFADVQAGAEKTYEIAGTSGHRHQVTLTAGDMKSLLAGALLRTTSNRGLTHTHRIVVRCAPAADPPEWVSVCRAEFSGKDEHEIVIPAADMAAAKERTYDVQGIAGHTHQVTVTADDFQKLAKGEAVSIRTTRDETDAHLHVVFIQYRPPKAA